MKHSKQQLLDIGLKTSYASEEFITSVANLTAYNAIKNYEKWPNRSLLLVGEEGSGKTHLSTIWQSKSNAKKIFEEDDLSNYSNEFGIVFENIEKCKNEKFLFHLINFCKENGIYLLLTSEYIPSFNIKDLSSRIGSMLKIEIRSPDEDLLKTLLYKRFDEIQIKVEKEVIDYLLIRINRSYSFVKKFTQEINKLSLQEKRSITIPFARNMLESSTLNEFLEEKSYD